MLRAPYSRRVLRVARAGKAPRTARAAEAARLPRGCEVVEACTSRNSLSYVSVLYLRISSFRPNMNVNISRRICMNIVVLEGA